MKAPDIWSFLHFSIRAEKCVFAHSKYDLNMKYTIAQIRSALESHSLNESQLFEKRLSEVHEMFMQLKRRVRRLNESNDENSKTFEKTVDVTERHMKDLKTPEDFKRFVEKNRDKVETALKNMPEKKRPAYKRAWDIVCKAAKGTAKFIMNNFALIAQAVLVLVLVWVFRDALGWLRDAVMGDHERKRLEEYTKAVEGTAEAAREFTTSAKKTAKNDYYKGFVQKAKQSAEGKKILANITKVQIDKGIEAIKLQQAKDMRALYDEDPSGWKWKFKEFGKSYEDAAAMVLHSIKQSTVDETFNKVVDSKIEELNKGGALEKLAAKYLEKAKIDTSGAWQMGYTKADIESQNDQTLAYKMTADIQKQILNDVQTANSQAQASSRILRTIKRQEAAIDNMKKQTHELLMSVGRDATAHDLTFNL